MGLKYPGVLKRKMSPAAMPIDQSAPIAVSSRSRAYRLTHPMMSAARRAAITAPVMGVSHVTPHTWLRYNAAPMPPSTECAIAPAMYVIRRTTTTVPTTPNATLASNPTTSAYRMNGMSGLRTASRNSPMGMSLLGAPVVVSHQTHVAAVQLADHLARDVAGGVHVHLAVHADHALHVL